MKKIFSLCIVVLGMTLHVNAQRVWAQTDTVYVSPTSNEYVATTTYRIACLQCGWRTKLLEVEPVLIDTSLSKFVSFELITGAMGEWLTDTVNNAPPQEVSYRMRILKQIPNMNYQIGIRFRIFTDRPEKEIRDITTIPVPGTVVHILPSMVEFYSNPDSSERMIPVFDGVKSFLVGSYILKNNHPTKKLRVSAIKYGFVDTTSWQYFAGIGQTEQMPHEVSPGTSVAFNFWMQLRSPSHEVAIQPILYLRCWYDDDTTLYDVDALGQLANLNAKALGVTDDLQNQYLVYPNPCTDHLMVTGTQDIPVVVNTLGQKMNIEIAHTATGWEVSTSLLPSGIYFLNGKTKFFKQ